MKKRYFLLYALAVLYIFVQCEDDRLITDDNAKLEFSVDTVFFDTVFTTIGTTTQVFKVYNKHNRSIEISEIYLGNGSNSMFRMNVDGQPVRSLKNKKVGPKDSLFVFVEATVSPNNENTPIVAEDSIVFITNGNVQDVNLLAWGQDMHYFKNKIIDSDTWVNDKPYLIYNALVVDSNEVLTIEAGAQIYLHYNSSIIVWGSIIINGTAEEPVVFQGDRLEEKYKYAAGQWGTIAMVEGSKANKINHTIIKNAIVGLWFGHDTVVKPSQAEISNSIIVNSSSAGILSYGSKLDVYNTVIANSGQANMMLLFGGDYNVYHCSFYNTNSSFPSVLINNFTEYQRPGNQEVFVVNNDLVNASFYNSIIHGTANKFSEIGLLEKEEALFDYMFDHCLLKIVTDSFDIDNTALFSNNIYNEDPKYIVEDYNEYNNELDYRLDTLSPAKDIADPSIINMFNFLETDIEGNSRTADSKPDLGAYERIENE